MSYLTTDGVAKYLGITTGHVKQLAKSGHLPHLPLREGVKKHYYKFPRAAVRDFKRQMIAKQVEGGRPRGRRAPKAPAEPGWIFITEATQRLAEKGYIRPQSTYIYDAITGRRPLGFNIEVRGSRQRQMISLADFEKIEKEATKNRRRKRIAEIDTVAQQPAAAVASADLPCIAGWVPSAKETKPTTPTLIQRVVDLEHRVSELQTTMSELIMQIGGIGNA